MVKFIQMSLFVASRSVVGRRLSGTVCRTLAADGFKSALTMTLLLPRFSCAKHGNEYRVLSRLSVHLFVMLWYNFNKSRPAINRFSPDGWTKNFSFRRCKDVAEIRSSETFSTGTVVPHYGQDAETVILFVCYRVEAATRPQEADVIMYCCCPPMTITSPDMINTRYYAITASQFVDKPRDASASVARGCSCEFASVTLYIRNGTRYPQCYYRTWIYMHSIEWCQDTFQRRISRERSVFDTNLLQNADRKP